MRASAALTALIVAMTSLYGCGGPDPDASATRRAAPQVEERARDFGDYILHFNAMTTDLLPPDVAQNFGIQRSKSRAMLNIVMMRKVEGTLGRASRGEVTTRTTNLTGQLKNLELRPVTEGDAIYYIGTIPVADGEVLIFDVEATPEGYDQTMRVKFQQQFFTK